jgi:hypothetical protein
MRYLVLALIAGFAVLCAGCLQDSYYWSSMFPGAYHRTRPPQQQEQPELAQAAGGEEPADAPLPQPGEESAEHLEGPAEAQPEGEQPPSEQPRLIERTTRMVVQPRPVREQERIAPQEPRFYAGFSFGNVYGNRGEAIDGEHNTDFDSGTLIGAQIGFLPRMAKTIQSPYFETRYGIEFRLQEHSMKLDWDGLDIGDVHVNSAVFAFKLFQTPKQDGVFGFHLEAGMGWGTTWFDKDDMLKQDDIDHGRHTRIDVDSTTIFAFGAGADLYISPEACVTLGFRFQLLDIPVKWSVDGVYDRKIERLNASNGQVFLSFNFFF